MAITTEDGYIAAAKQKLVYSRTGALTTVASSPSSPFNVAGNPGAGTLAGSSVTTGVVPTDATAGCPLINAFGVGNTGYLTRVEFGSSVACRIALYDMLWKGGAYPFNAAQAVTSPSWASRIPGGTDYSGLELWYEQVTAGTLVQNVNVSYTDAANAAQTTGVQAAPAAMIANRMFQLPLVAGGQTLKSITNVAGSVASAGTFNILVLRPLWSARVKVNNDGDVHDIFKTGMPQVFEDSAIIAIVTPDSTALGLPDLAFQISNG